MENKTFTPINIILIIAVAVLFYLQFSNGNNMSGEAGTTDSTAVENPVVIATGSIKNSKIVYVNSDVLNEEYEFVKEISTAAKVKQQQLETRYKQKAQKLQQDYAELQQKASQGLLSENQGAAAQEDMMKRKEELDRMDQQMQGLMEEFQQKNVEVRTAVVDYLKAYNETAQYEYILTYTDGPGGVIVLANDSLDITTDVLKGLNEQYKAKKEAKKVKAK